MVLASDPDALARVLGQRKLLRVLAHKGSGSLSGAFAGGQIGFNWQAGMFVFGAEIDGQWSGQQSIFRVGCRSGCTATQNVQTKSQDNAQAKPNVVQARQVASATNEPQPLLADEHVIYTDAVAPETKPAKHVAKKGSEKEEDQNARMKRIMAICAGC